jgi:steroid delta-isomerase-like uncharacterized protein
MSQDNVALARQWFEEVWNQRRTDTIDELLTPESVGHLEGGDLVGPEPFKRLAHAAFLAAFPDLRITVEDTVAEGDRVVVRWSATGTHHGDGLGHRASGVKVSFRGITWLRFAGGKMMEGWDAWNQGAPLQCLAAAAATG